MSLLDLRMPIETSSQITIMQLLFKSQVDRSIQVSTPEKGNPYVACAEEKVVH